MHNAAACLGSISLNSHKYAPTDAARGSAGGWRICTASIRAQESGGSSRPARMSWCVGSCASDRQEVRVLGLSGPASALSFVTRAGTATAECWRVGALRSAAAGRPTSEHWLVSLRAEDGNRREANTAELPQASDARAGYCAVMWCDVVRGGDVSTG